VSVLPFVLRVGGVHVTVTEPVAIWVTASENAASEALALPSLTLMTMLLVVPMFAAAGVPVSLPVDVLKVAQDGLFVMLNVRGSLLASAAVGWKEYAVPTATDFNGVPVIVGGELVEPPEAATTIENVGSEALVTPSLAWTMMLEYVPTFAATGVPLRRPVVVLKVAHAGLFRTLKVTALPSGSFAVG